MDVAVDEAARRLGISLDAVRKRAARGTLASRHDGRRLLITLPDDTPEAPPDARPDTDQPPDAADQPRPDADQTALIAALQEMIGVLRDQVRQQDEQLQAKDEQIRRAQEAEAEQRRIIAALAARLPELAAPIEATANGHTHDGTMAEASPTPAPRRPWWRFWRWGAATAGE